jgi:hypothetical protein
MPHFVPHTANWIGLPKHDQGDAQQPKRDSVTPPTGRLATPRKPMHKAQMPTIDSAATGFLRTPTGDWTVGNEFIVFVTADDTTEALERQGVRGPAGTRVIHLRSLGR